MLKILRKKGVAKKILWVTAVVIILSFGFFGSANYLTKANSRITYAGKIFGKKISIDQYENAYHHTSTQAALRYGENFNKIAQFLNLDMETWDRLILLHEAKKRRIKVSDDEIVRTIEEYPFFQRNSRFDPLLYNDVLRYSIKTSAQDFEQGTRETLTFAKLFDQVTSDLHVSDDELFEFYKKEKEQTQISYILFSSDDFKKDATIDETKIQEYFEKSKDRFSVPEMINVEYIRLPFEETTPTADKDQAKQKIQKISGDLHTNPDLKAAAAANGAEVKETGLFSQDQPNLNIGFSFDLLKKSFDLSDGEISDPIETDSGVYILRLKEKKEAHIPDFAEVADKVKDAMRQEKAKEIAKDKAEQTEVELQKLLTGGQNLTQAANSLKLTTTQTPFFGKGQYLPNIGISKDFQDTALSLKDETQISSPVETPKGFTLLHLDGKKTATKDEFAKDKDEFMQKLLEQKKSETFNEFLTALRMKANLEDNVSKLKKTDN